MRELVHCDWPLSVMICDAACPPPNARSRTRTIFPFFMELRSLHRKQLPTGSRNHRELGLMVLHMKTFYELLVLFIRNKTNKALTT